MEGQTCTCLNFRAKYVNGSYLQDCCDWDKETSIQSPAAGKRQDRQEEEKKRKKHAAGCCCLVSWSYDECRGIRCRESVMRALQKAAGWAKWKESGRTGNFFYFLWWCLLPENDSWIFIRRPTPSNPPTTQESKKERECISKPLSRSKI